MRKNLVTYFLGHSVLYTQIRSNGYVLPPSDTSSLQASMIANGMILAGDKTAEYKQDITAARDCPTASSM